MNIRIVLILALALSLALNAIFLYEKYKYKKAQNSLSYSINQDVLYSQIGVKLNDIVFFGDSHTEFFELYDFFENPNLKNRGINGDKLAKAKNRIGPEIKGHPKKIFIQFGINDLWAKRTIDQILKDYNSVIDTINNTSANSKVYVQSLFPQTGRASADTVLKLNQGLKELSKRKNAIYIDIYSKLQLNGKLNKKYDCGDGIHLSYLGYKTWSTALKPYL